MLVSAESLLQDAYDAAAGAPFALPMLTRWLVFVSARAELAVLERAPEAVLSMEHALHELAFTGPILADLQVKPGSKGEKSEGFRVMIGVLKNKLRGNVSALSCAFRRAVKGAVEKEFGGSGEEAGGQWKYVSIMPALLRIFTRVNLVAFLGEENASKLEVYDDVMAFFWSCASAFPLASLVPAFTLSLVAPVAMGFGATRRVVYDMLYRSTRESVAGEAKNTTCITHWVVEMTKLRDAAAIARITLGLLFASAFQVPMIAQFVLYRMCKHPEYIDALRAEAKEMGDSQFGSRNEEMPYLDSFIKETSRLSPGPILSAPRAVMEDYTLPSGGTVPAGNWLAVPQLTLMRDTEFYDEPTLFKPFRFVASKMRWTHPSHEYPFWGSIRHACPARFYVSVVMKMILAEVLVGYEIKLKDAKAAPCLAFGQVRLPSPFMVMSVRKRSVEGTS
jgi:hypothetical protein